MLSALKSNLRICYYYQLCANQRDENKTPLRLVEFSHSCHSLFQVIHSLPAYTLPEHWPGFPLHLRSSYRIPLDSPLVKALEVSGKRSFLPLVISIWSEPSWERGALSIRAATRGIQGCVPYLVEETFPLTRDNAAMSKEQRKTVLRKAEESIPWNPCSTPQVLVLAACSWTMLITQEGPPSLPPIDWVAT